MDQVSSHPGRNAAPGLLSVSAARRKHMEEGAFDLANWIRDVLATGVIHLPEHRPTVERMAARLVDAQLGSLAKRLRIGLECLDSEPDWQRSWLALLAQLQLFTKLFARIESLPAPLSYDIWQYAGVFIKKKDVQAGKAVQDQWVVLGTEWSPEERLISRKVWLFGLNTRFWAMLLDFGLNSRSLDPVPRPGQVWDAVLSFYPSATGHRALVLHNGPTSKWGGPPMGFSSWDEAIEYRYQRLMKNPLEEQFPCMIRCVMPSSDPEGKQYISDLNGVRMTLESKLVSQDVWTALSSNGPLTAFGELSGQRFSAWSVYTQGRLIACN